MIDLVATVKTARSIANAVEGGAIESTFADLGLQAAKDALSKVPYAEDKEAQVRSAVTHLEGAEAALRTTIQNRGTRLLYSNINALAHAMFKRVYILGLMAVCYRYLGERALTERTLSMTLDAKLEYAVKYIRGQPLAALPNLLSPLNWAGVVKDVWHQSRAESEARRAARRAGASKEAEDEAARLAGEPYPYSYNVASFSRSLTATWTESPGDLLNFREYGL
jgi:hypothetical protein